MVNNWLNNTLSLFFPYRCVLCQQASDVARDLCVTCESLQTRTPTSHCSVCAIPLPGATDAMLCGECLYSQPHYARAFIPYIYEHGIRTMVSQLKFNSRLIHARLLAELFYTAARQQRLEPAEVLIPMPLHGRRQSQRGYNQSQLLAKAIGKHWGLPVASQYCRRTKHIPPQSGLTRKQRVKNIKGVFEIIHEVPYRHIAIIDDVMTTGSSVNELAKMFKQAGVQQVDVWCMARTVKE